ncbi:hypothetical protein QFC22_006139 [Naganishia vaughanmartiniae]|uniref:Uncharacterized protein n=1 Tax=Naganishia vaughanmartiniae TaxID=1424756 RepID=A0ACC2WNP7_9TREE|nr:hypothetical protein QFC22_006139 [Naganishia vaughanmartiniae]
MQPVHVAIRKNSVEVQLQPPTWDAALSFKCETAGGQYLYVHQDACVPALWSEIDQVGKTPLAEMLQSELPW